VALTCAAWYRARNPRATPLYRLFDAHFDEVRGQWEERYEQRYGFWRRFVDEQVMRYLDCGLFENGFARIRCPDCAEEYLLAFSCKTRELCPSCAAKRSAATAAMLAEEVIEEVGHAQWVFVMPKMLPRPSIRRNSLPASSCTSPSRGGTWCGTTGGTRMCRGKRRKTEAENGEVVGDGDGPASRAARDEVRDARAMRRSWAQLMRT